MSSFHDNDACLLIVVHGIVLCCMGVALVSVYYCAQHPNRTDTCYLIGVPKHCSCEDVIGNVDLPVRE